MYIFSTKTARGKNRKRSSRFRAKLKAKNRRRVNRMSGRTLGRKRTKTH